MLQLLKPAHLEPVLCNKRSHLNEKPTDCKQGSPCSLQLEKAHAQQQRPNAVKNTNIYIKKKKEPKLRDNYYETEYKLFYSVFKESNFQKDLTFSHGLRNSSFKKCFRHLKLRFGDQNCLIKILAVEGLPWWSSG